MKFLMALIEFHLKECDICKASLPCHCASFGDNFSSYSLYLLAPPSSFLPPFLPNRVSCSRLDGNFTEYELRIELAL